MSLYTMLHGINDATFFILPMLGEKHPIQYPRFRDCFARDNEIHIFTRVGGGNRHCGFNEEELQSHPNYLRDFDDDFDSTYATYVFSVPDEFKEDYAKIISGRVLDISVEYKNRIYKVYPKLKEKLDLLFNTPKTQS